jgi:hypothetical protein
MIQKLPEDIIFRLNSEKRVLVIGAYPQAPHVIKREGEDRWVDLQIKDVTEGMVLPGRNFTHILVNGKSGRLSLAICELIEGLASRMAVEYLFFLNSGEDIVKTLEGFPQNYRGMIEVKVFNVIERAEIRGSPSNPPVVVKKGESFGNTAAVGSAVDGALPRTHNNGSEAPSTVRMFVNPSSQADNRIATPVTGEGSTTENFIKIAVNPEVPPLLDAVAQSVPTDLLSSDGGKKLLAVIEESAARRAEFVAAEARSNETIAILAGAVAAENAQLIRHIKTQDSQPQSLHEMKEKIRELTVQLNRYLAAADKPLLPVD